jgi:ABC-2 type transport system ATP-binding protein
VLPYGRQPVGAFLEHHANYFSSWDRAYANELCETFDLDVNQRCSRLSKGQVRRVQIISAFAHRPPLLLLDEPADGLDPVARDQFFGVLADHVAASPTTVVISSHVVHEADLLADRLGVLGHGQLDVQLDRETMDQYLRRYVVTGASNPGHDIGRDLSGDTGIVLSRRDGGAETELIVWGDEQQVTGAFENAGRSVRTARTLSLPEATRALMSQGGGE